MARTPTSVASVPPLEGDFIPKKRKQGAGRRFGKKLADLDTPPFSAEQWSEFIALVSNRINLSEAMVATGMTRYSLDLAIRGNEKYRQQWEDAKLTALRVNWDAETVEDIMVSIAMGSTVQAACDKALRGDMVAQFYRLVLKDPVIKELYEEARQIQAEKMAIDDIIDISDDAAEDTTWDGKGNSAAVNRARLKVDSRKWIASKLHHKRFGDRIQQDVTANIVVDHAARLEAARKRKARVIDITPEESE